jgi:hypothetical protein
MNPDIDEDHDAILFPFNPSAMDRGLGEESWAYSSAGFNVWDTADAERESATHAWGAGGRLIIYGHGSAALDRRHHMYGDTEGDVIVTPPELAALIKKLNFPKGAGNEIIVWSCHSGKPHGFAHLLALHLINEGYTGKKVWGCTKYGGTIDRAHKCLKASEEVGDRTHRATDEDTSFYIGVGNPLVR